MRNVFIGLKAATGAAQALEEPGARVRWCRPAAAWALKPG